MVTILLFFTTRITKFFHQGHYKKRNFKRAQSYASLVSFRMQKHTALCPSSQNYPYSFVGLV